MKNIYLFLLSSLIFLVSCDPVSRDERLVEIPAVTVQHNVLIEEFTGQRCIFCPEAATAIVQLQNSYGADKLIAVAFHAGPLALKNTSSVVGLRTDMGDMYYKHWAVPNVPKALINRHGGVLSKDAWAGRVYDELAQTTTISIDLRCQYNANKRQVNIETDLKSLKGNVNGKLQLWLVEDNVVAPQLFPNNKLEKEYVHRHVFRAAINGEWGTELMLSNTMKEKFLYTLPEGMKPNRVWVIGFFYNESGVLQVVQQRVSLS